MEYKRIRYNKWGKIYGALWAVYLFFTMSPIIYYFNKPVSVYGMPLLWFYITVWWLIMQFASILVISKREGWI
ncbi:MAG: hypothetical protein QXJ15_04685 [Candidatus Bathyarchaeia archaeon]